MVLPAAGSLSSLVVVALHVAPNGSLKQVGSNSLTQLARTIQGKAKAAFMIKSSM